MFVGIEIRKTTVRGKTYVRVWPFLTGTAKQRNTAATIAVVTFCIIGLVLIGRAQETPSAPAMTVNAGIYGVTR